MGWTPDSEIDLRARHPDFQEFLDFKEAHSERARERYACVLDVEYGPERLQTLDLFPGSRVDAPLLAFIHGGYWRGLDKRSYGFVAPPFVDAGCSVAVLNYRLLPHVRMAAQIGDVVVALEALLAGRFAAHGVVPRKLALAGHSAGGHLALTAALGSQIVCTGLVGLVSLSGLFELRRIQASSLDRTLALSDDEVARHSPLREPWSLSCPVYAGVGGGETQLFVSESAALAAHAGVELERLAMLNHYEVAHLLGQPDSSPTRFLLGALTSS